MKSSSESAGSFGSDKLRTSRTRNTKLSTRPRLLDSWLMPVEQFRNSNFTRRFRMFYLLILIVSLLPTFGSLQSNNMAGILWNSSSMSFRLFLTYTHTHTHTHTYILTYIWHIYKYIHTNIYTYINAYTNLHTNTCTYVHMQAHIHTYIHTYLYTIVGLTSGPYTWNFNDLLCIWIFSNLYLQFRRTFKSYVFRFIFI
jgi:hypothetical protein